MVNSLLKETTLNLTKLKAFISNIIKYGWNGDFSVFDVWVENIEGKRKCCLTLYLIYQF